MQAALVIIVILSCGEGSKLAEVWVRDVRECLEGVRVECAFLLISGGSTNHVRHLPQHAGHDCCHGKDEEWEE